MSSVLKTGCELYDMGRPKGCFSGTPSKMTSDSYTKNKKGSKKSELRTVIAYASEFSSVESMGKYRYVIVIRK